MQRLGVSEETVLKYRTYMLYPWAKRLSFSVVHSGCMPDDIKSFLHLHSTVAEEIGTKMTFPALFTSMRLGKPRMEP